MVTFKSLQSPIVKTPEDKAAVQIPQRGFVDAIEFPKKFA
jgi:hypothetical protein